MFVLISLLHIKTKTKERVKNFLKILHTVTMATKFAQTTGASVRIFKTYNFNSGQGSLHVNFNIKRLFSLQYYKSNKLRFTTSVYRKTEHIT